MPNQRKIFETNARKLIEQLANVPESSTALDLAQRYADQDRWLAAWAVLQPQTPAADFAVLENERLRLFACLVGESVHIVLLDRRSGRTFAEGPYIYRLETGDARRRTVTESLEETKIHAPSDTEMHITGRIDAAAISHRFRLDADASGIEESITLRNQSDEPLHISRLNFGLTVPATTPNGRLLHSAKAQRWVAVPFRRETLGLNGEYEDYSVPDLLTRRGWYRVVCVRDSRLPSDDFGSEAWVCTNDDASLLVLKYSQHQMEFSLLGVESMEQGAHLRFGGCGIFHGDPECLAEVEPGREIHFGLTRYQLIDGGWKEGYYAFRESMSRHGHGVTPDFDPPVHWNEIYDNQLFWSRGTDSDEMRKELYSLKHMEEEAAKAKEIGCQALYLDPGWDTPFASQLWDEDRLGPAKDFVKLMDKKYGLKVSLWVPLTRWRGAPAFPREADRLDENGNRLSFTLCGGSSAFLDIKAERLLKLCAAGVSFLMFDGSKYTGPCFDKNHGHPVPYTREAHCRACLELAQRVHEKFPDVIIEMHDMIGGGTMLRYCPNYYLHGLEGSHDENWGFEYMWRPLEDLLKGWAVSLYYYNLAYELPLYLHIDLRVDNPSALEFWWYASTCRHLGIGGTHPDPAVRAAHKAAMSRYLKLKEFYTRGKFYGLDECIHLHVLPERKALVVNLFNLDAEEKHLTGTIDLEEIGIAPVRFIQTNHMRQYGDRTVNYDRRLPPHSTTLIELHPC